MYPQRRHNLVPAPGKLSEKTCKAKTQELVTIPESWGLNELQRSFIDTMIDKKLRR
ncbi:MULTISPECIES: hypothetical protein [unclassified Erwinia]|uniref:hypothetical protein n=1 Tax=unclassified Erwinia TaxID=2622719 RepID=UPI00130426DF|nr:MULTISPECIES: hypothetical protein [unclassified Erwinia]